MEKKKIAWNIGYMIYVSIRFVYVNIIDEEILLR